MNSTGCKPNEKEISHHSVEFVHTMGNLTLSIITKELKQELEQSVWLTDWHFHSVVEITVLLSGNETVSFNTKNYTLSENDAIIVPPKLLHKAIPESEKQTKISMLLSLTVKTGEKPETDCEKAIYRLFEFLQSEEQEPIVLKCYLSGIRKLLDMNGIGDASPFAEEHRKLLLVQFMLDIFDRLNQDFSLKNSMGKSQKTSLPKVNADNRSTRAQLVEEYLYHNMNESCSLEELSEYLHLSKRQVSRFLLKNFGCTFKQIVNSMRCQMIKDMLMEGKHLSEITELTGFQSQNGLRKLFKTYTGMTPSEYISYQKIHFPVTHQEPKDDEKNPR